MKNFALKFSFLLFLFLPVSTIYATCNRFSDGIPRDSISSKLKISKDKFRNSGTINFDYHYGVQAFNQNQTGPEGYFLLDGDGLFSYGILPVAYNYRFTTLKSYAGLTNYFHLRPDLTAFRQKITEKLTVEKNQAMADYAHLQLQKDSISQKLSFLGSKYSKQNLESSEQLLNSYQQHILKLGADSINRFKENEKQFIDSVQHKDTDSILNCYNEKKTRMYEDYSYSQKQVDELKHFIEIYDSVQSEIIQGKRRLDSISQKTDLVQNNIRQYQQLIQEIQNGKIVRDSVVTKNESINQKFGQLKKIIGLLQSVKNVEVGLCNPDFSSFLINGTPLKGLNFELLHNNLFLEAACGKTLKNNMANYQQNKNAIIGGLRNAFNYFDFNDTASVNTLAVVKGGIGLPEGTHFYLGYLHGNSLGNTDSSTQKKTPNNVWEADFKWAINARNKFDAIYCISNSLINENSINTSKLFIYKSAWLLRETSLFPKTNTEIRCTYRVIGPDFKSVGASFIVSDNSRFELKLRQQLGHKMRLTLHFKSDKNNLKNNQSATMILKVAGFDFIYMPSPQWRITALCMPAYQYNSGEINSELMAYESLNYTAQGNLAWKPKSKKALSGIIFNFGIYHLYSLENSLKPAIEKDFKNINCIHTFNIGSKKTINIKLQWFLEHQKAIFENHLQSDSLKHTAMIEVAWNGEINKHLTACLAFNESQRSQIIASKMQHHYDFGYRLQLNYNFKSRFAFKLNFEKISQGDFLSGYNQQLINSNPYQLTAGIKAGF